MARHTFVAAFPALLLAALLAAPATAQVPQIDDLPPLPQQDDLPPLPPAKPPKGSKKAVFDVIVEGSGGASLRVDGDGTNGVCQVTSHTEIVETYEYGRGRGLRVVATRIGRGRRSTVILTRAGRRFGYMEFNVRATVDASAEGQASRSGDPTLCVPLTEAVGDESGCGPKRRRVNYGLAYDSSGKLSLDVIGDVPPLPPRFQPCGTNGVETMSGPPLAGWNAPPPLNAAPLPWRRLFRARRPLKVELESDPFEQRYDSPNPTFAGRGFEQASHGAVVRFIPVRPKP
jgi:hypothetical protein